MLWGRRDLADREWVVTFLKAVGSDPDQFPPELLAAAVPLVPLCRRGRPAFDADLPLAELGAASAVVEARATRSSSRASRSTRCCSASGGVDERPTMSQSFPL